MENVELPKQNQDSYDVLLLIQKHLSGDDVGYSELAVPSNGESRITSLVGKKWKNELLPLFTHRSGSMLAGWLQKSDGDWEKMPILWLDSEGSPNMVFALGLSQLFRLLHFYPGSLYDVLAVQSRYVKKPSLYDSPEEAFPDNEILTRAKRFWAEDEDFNAFHIWLKNELGIEIEENPVLSIVNAHQNSPKFEEALGR